MNEDQLQNRGYTVVQTLSSISINAFSTLISVGNTYPLLKLPGLDIQCVTLEIVKRQLYIYYAHVKLKSELFITQFNCQQDPLITDNPDGHQQDPFLITYPTIQLQTQMLFTIYELLGQSHELYDIIENYGQMHQFPEIYALMSVQVHKPETNAAPDGQLHTFDQFMLLIPHVQASFSTKAPLVQQAHSPFLIAQPTILQTQTFQIILELDGHIQIPFQTIEFMIVH
ncbi:Hypothetical_protein [Hexamita inflata]|uniref:Hypothetical_protein n=1 Tax=Hexamita inflata TaxID=28002 RepID=A0AA86U8Q2_9EUKA|nr:Hypothetical protein HINF_LOCUS29447 [Hexamita inflata]